MNTEEIINKIYNDAFQGNLNSKGVMKLIEKIRPEYKSARIAAQYGKKARDMYDCVELAMKYFNEKFDTDQNWMYFTIGGNKTCKDVLKWLEEVINDHIKYRTEHNDEEE